MSRRRSTAHFPTFVLVQIPLLLYLPAQTMACFRACNEMQCFILQEKGSEEMVKKVELSGVEKVETPGGFSTYAETPNVAIAKGVAQLVPPGKRPPS